MHSKILSGLLTVTMTFGFTACTGGENLSQGVMKSTSANKSITSTATETTTKVPTTVGTIATQSTTNVQTETRTTDVTTAGKTSSIELSTSDPYYDQKKVIVEFADNLLSPDHHQLETVVERIMDVKVIEQYDLKSISEKTVPKVDYYHASRLENFEKAMAFEATIYVKYKDIFRKYVTADDGVKTFTVNLVKFINDPNWKILSIGYH